MKTGPKILLGCLAVPFVLVAVLLILFLGFRAAGPPEHRMETARLEQPIAAPTAQQLAAEGLAVGGAGQGPPVAVNLILEEGYFSIKAGPPGSAIRVEGDYDAGAYELKQEVRDEGSGRQAYFVSFRPRYSFLRRIFSEGGIHVEEGSNPITVSLPAGVPLNLNMRVVKGASRADLGGLSLESARLALEMGEHHLTVSSLNPIAMSLLEVNAGMGEVRLGDLGNLRAGSLNIWGKMGEVNVDMGRELARDTKLFTRMKMGEMTVLLPSVARISSRVSVFLADMNGKPEDGGSEGPALDITSSVTFGELRFSRN